jgi:hypothetical protein
MAKEPLKDPRPLVVAISSGASIDAIKTMLGEGYALRGGKGQSDPLKAAIARRDPVLVEMLFAAGAKIKPSDDLIADQIVPELRARPDEHRSEPSLIAVFDVLAKHKVNVNAADKQTKQAALHIASLYGRSDIVRWLLAHGADPLAMNGDGKTPRDLAEESAKLQEERKAKGEEPSWARPPEGLALVIPMLKEAEQASGREKPLPPGPEDKWPIMKIPVAQRRGICDHSLESAAQVLIQGTPDEISNWFAQNAETDHVEKDVLDRSDLPDRTGPLIGLVQFKGHTWTFVTGLPRALAGTITKWSKTLPNAILLAETNDTSGIAKASIYRGGKVAEKLQSSEKSWANVEKFLKDHDAYFTIVYADVARGKVKLSGYHEDEAQPATTERVDLVYLKPATANG